MRIELKIDTDKDVECKYKNENGSKGRMLAIIGIVVTGISVLLTIAQIIGVI